jgi:hypothetical protein
LFLSRLQLGKNHSRGGKMKKINIADKSKLTQILAAHWYLTYPLLISAICGIVYSNYQSIRDFVFGSDHHYEFIFDNKMVTGESSNQFEDASNYSARIEVCERNGIEGIEILISCYLTIKPKTNLTISNSLNFTTAYYSDGNVATICCMYFDRGVSMPLYRIALRRGDIVRRTVNKGEEMQIQLLIPDAKSAQDLDSISFSPGEGAPAVVFPLRGNLRDGAFLTAEFINNHKDDPRIQSMIERARAHSSKIRAVEKLNEGLTYPKE